MTSTPTTTSALKMQVTGWQSAEQTNPETGQAYNTTFGAYIGPCSPRLGVTGIGDLNGNSGYHQIDNSGGYNDFAPFQFDAPVILTSLNINSFVLGGATTKDNGVANHAANIPTAAWNTPINLTQYTTALSTWKTTPGTSTTAPCRPAAP